MKGECQVTEWGESFPFPSFLSYMPMCTQASSRSYCRLIEKQMEGRFLCNWARNPKSLYDLIVHLSTESCVQISALIDLGFHSEPCAFLVCR